jgi:UDP-N-acetylmuramoylalanine--D-glutamate ligase
MDLRGKKVLVVGLARTGLAVSRFLKTKGAVVSATEMRSREEMRDVAKEVEGLGIAAEWGGHGADTFLKPDLIVVSPGIDLNLGPLQQAIQAGIRVISEMELAYLHIHVPIIGITGTNGKTTTTVLVGELLKEAGRRVGVGGNVGEPLILFAEGGDRWDILVAEISSFQLEAIEAFRPRISILINVTEDHLDRYACYQDYINAKARIFMNQTPEDLAILNRDDRIVMDLADTVKARKVFFSLEGKPEKGAFYDGRSIVLRLEGKEEAYPLTDVPLKGIHNVENMMAALLTARSCGCSPEAIRSVLERFHGLEHRLELVREIGGIRFYDDSKGTNVGSVVKSLLSFTEPVILIAGGKDKGGDLSPLQDGIRSHVRRLILIGEAKERMAQALGALTETVKAPTLEEAVLLAYRSARRGDVVLLSPACSSFDMFKDYKERGRVFQETVRKLKEEAPTSR